MLKKTVEELDKTKTIRSELNIRIDELGSNQKAFL